MPPPKWIIEKIKQERLENFKNYPSVVKEEASDTEIVAFLFTACLTNPPDHDIIELYSHLVVELASKQFGQKISDYADIEYKPVLSSDAHRYYEQLKKAIFRSVKKQIDELLRYVKKTQKEKIPHESSMSEN